MISFLNSSSLQPLSLIRTSLAAVAGAAISFLGGAIGSKAGEIIDEARSLFKCNKCGKEFEG